MNPEQLVNELHHIALMLGNSKSPSRDLVLNRLSSLVQRLAVENDKPVRGGWTMTIVNEKGEEESYSNPDPTPADLEALSRIIKKPGVHKDSK